MFIGAFRAYPLATIVSTTGIVITAFYVLRLLQKLFFGARTGAVAGGGAHAGGHGPTAGPAAISWGDANPVELCALGLLAVFILVVGLYPLPFMQVIGSAVAPVAAKLGGL